MIQKLEWDIKNFDANKTYAELVKRQKQQALEQKNKQNQESKIIQTSDVIAKKTNKQTKGLLINISQEEKCMQKMGRRLDNLEKISKKIN